MPKKWNWLIKKDDPHNVASKIRFQFLNLCDHGPPSIAFLISSLLRVQLKILSTSFLRFPGPFFRLTNINSKKRNWSNIQRNKNAPTYNVMQIIDSSFLEIVKNKELVVTANALFKENWQSKARKDLTSFQILTINHAQHR